MLGNVERKLRGASRPAIVAVSVNPWGNQHANLIRDIHHWRTGSAWRWAIGARTSLERVWQAYQIAVKARVVRVAGKPIHELSHTEMIYVIDANGDERVAWPWPFTAAEVLGSIRSLQPPAA